MFSTDTGPIKFRSQGAATVSPMVDTGQWSLLTKGQPRLPKEMCLGRGSVDTQEGPDRPGSSNGCPLFQEHLLATCCIPGMERQRQTAFEVGQLGFGERSQATIELKKRIGALDDWVRNLKNIVE